MYRGWRGPPEWLFNFVDADGESAYELIEFEMFLIVLMVLLILFLILLLIIFIIKFITSSAKIRFYKKPLFLSCVKLDKTKQLFLTNQYTARTHKTKFNFVSLFFLVMLILFLVICLDAFVVWGTLLLYGGH